MDGMFSVEPEKSSTAGTILGLEKGKPICDHVRIHLRRVFLTGPES